MIFGKPHQIAIKSFFALFGIFPAKSRKYEQLIADQTKVEQLTIWLNLLKRIPEDKVSYFARNIEFSHSQFFRIFSSPRSLQENGMVFLWKSALATGKD